jgi:hypothetical protein
MGKSMALADTFDAHAWIKSKVPYGRDLEDATYQTIASLAVLCAWFEEQNQAGKKVLCDCADQAAHRLQGSLTAGYFTPNYRSIVWRNEDVATVEAVLMGQKTGPADQIMALLTISYRLRNNLFRGLKGIKDLNDQPA